MQQRAEIFHGLGKNRKNSAKSREIAEFLGSKGFVEGCFRTVGRGLDCSALGESALQKHVTGQTGAAE